MCTYFFVAAYGVLMEWRLNFIDGNYLAVSQ